MSQVVKNTPTRTLAPSGSLLQRNYDARIAAFKSVFGAWKHARIDHVKGLARLRKERDRDLSVLKRAR